MVETVGEDKATALKDEGNEKFKAKDYQGAIELYTSSITLNPSMHLSYSNRSACHVHLKNYEEALADAQKCIELDPSWAKGYHRVAAAYQGLKSWDKAIEVCRAGLEKSSGDNLEKMITDVQKLKFIEQLQGCWHGKVNEVLGGYDQAMEFRDDLSLTVEVLGKSSPGKYTVDVAQDPKHLNIQMQPPPQPGMFMPPVPPVPYIARIDESGLHLCCPYMKMERPAEFVGPGYCLMKKGKLEVEKSSEFEGLGRIEKLRLCAQELTKKLPSTKLEEPSPMDTEEQASEKLMSQVRFESQMYEIQKRFGEEIVKEVIEASRGFGSLDVRQLKEIAPMIEKLKTCGLLEDDQPPPSLASSGPKAQGPPAESKKAGQTDKAEKVENERGPTKEADLDAAASSDLDAATVAIALAAVAAVASFAYVLWRRQRR